MRTGILLVAAALLASGCIRTRTDPVTGKTDVDVESPLKKGEDWSGDLKGMGQWMSVSGVARARVLGLRTCDHGIGAAGNLWHRFNRFNACRAVRIAISHEHGPRGEVGQR